MKSPIVKIRSWIYLLVFIYLFFLLALSLSRHRATEPDLSDFLLAKEAAQDSSLPTFYQKHQHIQPRGQERQPETESPKLDSEKIESKNQHSQTTGQNRQNVMPNFADLKGDICSFSGKLVSTETKFTILRNALISTNEVSKSTEDRGEIFYFKLPFLSQVCKKSDDPPVKLSKVEIGCTADLQIQYLSEVSFSYQTTSPTAPPFLVFDWLVGIIRSEYANPFWAVIDIFDVFHIIKSMDVASSDDVTHIIWLDGHPASPTDSFWHVFFGKDQVHQLTDFNQTRPPKNVFASNFVARFHRRHSLFLKTRSVAIRTMFSTFRQEAYEKLGINPIPRNCSSLRLTAVWRRDYVNHLGNPAGKISRKVSNEKEVLSTMGQFQDRINITEVQLDTLSGKQQIELMSKTDIFFAIHGAGHVMSTFMPPGGVVIEVTIPSKVGNTNMQKVAENAGHKHLRETLPKSSQSADTLSHYIPPIVVQKLVSGAFSHLCAT